MRLGTVALFWTALLVIYYEKETDAAVRGVLKFLAALGGQQ